MSGTTYETSVAALQHGTSGAPDGAVKLGVVRRPTPWFYAHVDGNVPALAPATELVDEAKDRLAALREDGVDDPKAHNASMDDVDFDERYPASLDASEAARAAIDCDVGRRVFDDEPGRRPNVARSRGSFGFGTRPFASRATRAYPP